MNIGTGKKIKRVLFYICLAFIIGVVGFHYIQGVFAEQNGSSPDSGADSRLTAMAATVAALNFGSTTAGTWGDYGTALNRIYSAAQGTFNDAKANGTKNGSGTGATNYLSSYTQVLGGVDDYNNNQTTPTDAYKKTWITCDNSAQTPAHPGGNYCGTARSVAEKMDPNTGLVWSPRLTINGGTTADWFTANNCQQSSDATFNNGTGNAKSANACAANGNIGCVCIKLPITTETKTGCAAYDDGNWRLPYQKELMQGYIDGSWGNLTNAAINYWSSTTQSDNTYNAWRVGLYLGNTTNSTKVTTTHSVRCVR
jgi:hypothetical protein